MAKQLLNEQLLVDENILTKEPIRKYPLKMSSLQVILKVYAVQTYQPFKFYIYGMRGKSSDYYLTDYGLEWLYNFFKDKDINYIRSIFHPIFQRATQDTLQHLDTYNYFNNFRGTIGDRPKKGTKQGGLIVRRVGKVIHEYPYDTLAEARQHLVYLLSMYPIEQFTLYRVRHTAKKGTFKEKVKLILDPEPIGKCTTTRWTKNDFN